MCRHTLEADAKLDVYIFRNVTTKIEFVPACEYCSYDLMPYMASEEVSTY